MDGYRILVNYNITNSSQTNKAFKERLEELNRALQLCMTMMTKHDG